MEHGGWLVIGLLGSEGEGHLIFKIENLKLIDYWFGW